MNKPPNILSEDVPPDKPHQVSIEKSSPEGNSGRFCSNVSNNEKPIGNESCISSKLRDTLPCKNTKNMPRNTLRNIESQSESMDCSQIPNLLEDEEEFEIVRNKRIRLQPTIIDLSNFNVSTSGNTNSKSLSENRFAILGDLNIKTCSTSKSQLNTNTVPSPKTKRHFCPPIFLFNVDVKALVEELKSKNTPYKIVNVNKTKCKLYFEDTKAHSEMMQLLKNKQISSFTYTPKELKCNSIILRGLFYKTDTESIKKELDLLCPNSVQTVSKFTTNFSKKNGIDTGLFLITLPPGKQLNDLLSVKEIFNQRILWESPKKSSKVIQCWRCQLWGHMSRNCSRPFVCVKCDKEHDPGKCEFKSDENNLPYCANCKQHGHPSSYKGCPAYLKFLLNREKSRANRKYDKQQVIKNVSNAAQNSSFVQPGKSFANLLKNNVTITAQKIGSSNTLIDEFLKIANIICNPEPISLEDKLRKFINEYKSLPIAKAQERCVSLLNEINQTYGA